MPRARVPLQKFFEYCLLHQLPVAFYRSPKTKEVNVCAQRIHKLHRVSAKQTYPKAAGFLFAPFKTTKSLPALFIKGDILCREDNLPELNFMSGSTAPALPAPVAVTATTRKEFIQQVEAIKGAIQQGVVKKVVAARADTLKIPAHFKPVAFFKKLCRMYPQAFVSLVYTPASGIWIGATPEVLLLANRNEFCTYSLAGTKSNTLFARQQSWGEKETEEQKIVSDYIQQVFKKLTIKPPVINGPETVAAANLLHLRTTFTYRGLPYGQWAKTAAALHPTPAVGGLPKKKAIDFILRHEKAARQYYSGYLGPVNTHNETHLYVNLRCMNVQEHQLVIYTGCGITSKSVAGKEWGETEMKKRTLLNALG